MCGGPSQWTAHRSGRQGGEHKVRGKERRDEGMR